MMNIVMLQCLFPTFVDECHQNTLKRAQARVVWNTGDWGGGAAPDYMDYHLGLLNTREEPKDVV